MIAVWQKQEFDSVKDVPHLQAILTYQISPDERKVYCELAFETPYPVAKHSLKDGRITVNRYGDKVVCRYSVPDKQWVTLRIDHPEMPIYGCTTRYDRQENPWPFFFEPTFNMDITVREGMIYMPESEMR